MQVEGVGAVKAMEFRILVDVEGLSPDLIKDLEEECASVVVTPDNFGLTLETCKIRGVLCQYDESFELSGPVVCRECGGTGEVRMLNDMAPCSRGCPKRRAPG